MNRQEWRFGVDFRSMFVHAHPPQLQLEAVTEAATTALLLPLARKLLLRPRDRLTIGQLRGRGAFAIVLAHNHPNGTVSPTDQDKILTRAIVLAAATVKVRVVDHLIVSAQETFSFRKAGLL